MWIFFIFQFFIFLVTATYNDERKQWSWTCNASKKCEKVQTISRFSLNSKNPDFSTMYPLEVCRLICGQFGALWPRPTKKVELSQRFVYINPRSISFEILQAVGDANHFLTKNVDIFFQNLFSECGSTNCTSSEGYTTRVFVSILNSNTDLEWSTPESYSLTITLKDNNAIVEIIAENVFGARHGFETFSQLITSFKIKDGTKMLDKFVMVSSAVIHDEPIFSHRGLLLDSARNFLPVSTIKRQIRAMSYSKLNVLHWHISDTQSFPLKSKRVPQLSKYGAYSLKQTYSLSQVFEIIQYAKLRGIRVILEIDAPSHAGNGWQWGENLGFGKLALCVNQDPWRSYCIQPPCGQLNPINPKVYSILGDLYSDILEVYPNGEFFHMGGDEVFFPCWNSSEEIVSYLQKQNLGLSTESYLNLWSYFQEEALKAFDSKVGNHKTPIILWSSALTDPEHISKYLSNDRYIIETWVPSDNDLPYQLVEKGYRIIVSTKDAWYLDHGFWGNTRYHNWRTVYQNRLLRHPNVLGGEACMWGEYVDESSLDARIWPRTAAVGERLWSDPSTTSSNAEARFYRHRERMVIRGVKADAVGPRWCYENEGKCS